MPAKTLYEKIWDAHVVRDEPGFGYALDCDYVRHITVREEQIA